MEHKMKYGKLKYSPDNHSNNGSTFSTKEESFQFSTYPKYVAHNSTLW